MFNYGVSSELLGVGDGGPVITKDIHRVAYTGKHLSSISNIYKHTMFLNITKTISSIMNP
jgi:hypothetical protein